MRKLWLFISIFILMIGFTISNAAEWPERPITNVVFSSPGGGTDTTNRALAAAMEKFIGKPIKVVNMTGGGGGIAADYVWKQPHDGYYWLGASETLLSMCVMGAHFTTTNDWDYFVCMGAPGPISVKADSPFKTFEDLQKAVREKPGEIKIASSTSSSIWSIKMGVVRKYAGFEYKPMPFNGSGPSQVAVLTGEVDACHTSIGEQAELIRAGKLKPLIMVDSVPANFPGVGTIRPITNFYPQLKPYFPLPQWLGFMLPKDTPKPILEKITDAYKKALETETVRKLAETTSSTLYGKSGKDAKEMVGNLEKVSTWLLFELGVAKKSPAEFNIPKP
jgi:tripartite-type tricarboxylate transporter receptor subunit TctC